MTKPKVLIVGCGAVGLSHGFILSSVAEITFLVRPGRKPAFAPPKRLYDYKTDSLHTFSDYRLIDSTAEVAGEQFFCVFDTLDGATARTESGAATLRAVGDLIRAHPSTFVVYDAIGLDIALHYQQTMNLPSSRLLFGASMLAHQPTARISIPENASRALISQADLLYSTLGPSSALQLLKGSNPTSARAFADLYNKNDRKLTVRLGPGFVDPDLVGVLGIVSVMGWYLLDFCPGSAFVADRTGVWSLTVRAQTEALALPRFGWTGRLLSWVLGSWVTGKMVLWTGEAVLPLKANEFNAFHHGGKVVQQDLILVRDFVADGEKCGLKMDACRELVARIESMMRAQEKDPSKRPEVVNGELRKRV